MSRTIRWLVLTVFVLLVVSLTVVLIALSMLGPAPAAPWRPERVLLVELRGEIPELKPRAVFGELVGRQKLDLRDLLEAFAAARDDDSIVGVLLDVGGISAGWAQIEELREALEDLRESGKWTTAFFESAGEFGGGNASYYLASACDRVVVAPPGHLGLTGLRVETPFVRELLSRLEIEPQFGRRKEFKNAVNLYTERDYTDTHRQATSRLITSVFDTLVAGIVHGRALTPERVRELIDAGPFTAEEARDAGLIDDIAYRDEVHEEIESELGIDEPFIDLGTYLGRQRLFRGGWQRIALIYAVGDIARGPSRQQALGGQIVGSDTIAEALREAREDGSVHAVVLRVDSPGGSYVASDLIRRELALTRHEKPIVVSMGNVAASGGYFISMQANHLMADANTITGSIGVYAGKLVTHEFWLNKLGVRFSGLQVGENAELLSTQQRYDERGWERMDKMLDAIYEDFVSKAAEGRGLSVEQLEPLARGRVWSGRDALERGLIDEIGGLRRAVEVARELAGIPPNTTTELIVLPRRRPFFESLFGPGAAASLPPELRRILSQLAALADGQEELLIDRSVPHIR
ncbi:MAG: signal peptide peptidase SppA [Acidobacteriota bacterium]|nr:MAG: signal peptide peptidase SppA [Acidobacteriota bacterium]